MAEAIILIEGIVKKASNLSAISYQHRSGYVTGFTLGNIAYVHAFKEGFRREDQASIYASGGYYPKKEFLDYLVKRITPEEIATYKLNLNKLGDAEVNDLIRVRKLYIEAPYAVLYKKIEYSWSYNPVNAVFNNSGDIIIPSDAHQELIDVSINGIPKDFYDHNISLITSAGFTGNKNDGAYYIALIALQIKRINDDVFNMLNTPGLSSFIASQNVEWQFGDIFTLPTLEDLVQYLESLTNFYNSVYSNQVLIANAPEDTKLFWLANVLSASGLAVLSIEDKLALLKKIVNTHLIKRLYLDSDPSLLIYENGPSLILKIIESVTVMPTQADRLMQELLSFNYYDFTTNYTLFEILFNQVHDNRIGTYTSGIINDPNQRKELIQSIYNVWLISKYNPYYESPAYTQPAKSNGVFTESFFMTIEGKKLYDPINAPSILTYESKATDLSSFVTNFEYELNGANIDVTKVSRSSITLEHGGGSDIRRAHYGTYHIYQPVSVIGYKSTQQFDGFKNNCVPVFLLYYIYEFNEIRDFDLGAMLVFNIALSFDILGEISTLSYLQELSSVADVALPANSPVLLWDSVLGVNKVVRFTSGSSSAIFDYVAQKSDDPKLKDFCGTLSVFLGALNFGSECFDNLAQAKLMTATNNILIDRAHLLSLGTDVNLSENVIKELQTLANIDELIARMNTKLSQITFADNAKVTDRFSGLNHEDQLAFFNDFYFLDNDDIKWNKLDGLYDSQTDLTFVDYWAQIETKAERNVEFLFEIQAIRSLQELNEEVFKGKVTSVLNKDAPPQPPYATNHYKWAATGIHYKDGLKANGKGGVGRIVANTKAEIIPPGGYYNAKMEMYDPNFTFTTNSTKEVGWVVKKSNKGYSTFFPDSWSKQKVEEELTIAFRTKVYDYTDPHGTNIYKGTMSDGVECIIYINKNNIVTSMHPSFPK